MTLCAECMGGHEAEVGKTPEFTSLYLEGVTGGDGTCYVGVQYVGCPRGVRQGKV